MTIDHTCREVLAHCLGNAMPFAIIFMPGDSKPSFFAACGDGEAKFAVRKFTDAQSGPLCWLREASPGQIMADSTVYKDCQPPLERSTPPDDYRTQARSIIGSLTANGGKTVLSRVIALNSDRGFAEVVDDYFNRFPDTFRFVYYYPDTGLWFGASPELLLDYDTPTQTLRTMALAGTRPYQPGPRPRWDEKNIAEHRYVTDYILNTLAWLGLSASVYDSSDRRFGAIEHMCDRISAVGKVDPVLVADALSPTPALCGFPKDRAFRQIIDTEIHQRLCYGGWIAVMSPERFTAYVNLRSARACVRTDGTTDYNIFVGGGLTAQSSVDAEWAETASKAAALISSLALKN